jgi:hypothetical protein
VPRQRLLQGSSADSAGGAKKSATRKDSTAKPA